MKKISVGVDIGGSKMLMIAQPGDRLLQRKTPTGRNISVCAIEEEIKNFIGTLSTPVESIGIAVPGILNASSDAVEECDVIPQLKGWNGGELKAKGYNIAFFNDIAAGLVAESARNELSKVIVLVMSGTGIGAAMRIEGRHYHGANGWAGELGKMAFPIGHEIKTLDELASGAGILHTLGLDLETYIRLYNEKDERVIIAIAEAGKFMGLGLATLVHLLDPDVLITGGGMFRLMEYQNAAQKSLHSTLLPCYSEKLIIRPQEYGELSVAKGALLLAES